MFQTKPPPPIECTVIKAASNIKERRERNTGCKLNVSNQVRMKYLQYNRKLTQNCNLRDQNLDCFSKNTCPRQFIQRLISFSTHILFSLIHLFSLACSEKLATFWHLYWQLCASYQHTRQKDISAESWQDAIVGFASNFSLLKKNNNRPDAILTIKLLNTTNQI